MIQNYYCYYISCKVSFNLIFVIKYEIKLNILHNRSNKFIFAFEVKEKLILCSYLCKLCPFHFKSYKLYKKRKVILRRILLVEFLMSFYFIHKLLNFRLR